MKKASLLLLCSFVAGVGQAQVDREFIRNGSFEDLNKAVNTYDQFAHATGWSNVTLATSEVFDREASAKTVGIPDNDYGKIEPKVGDRFAGFCAWKADVRKNFDAYDQSDAFVPGWNSLSEYLKTELAEPLKDGVTYELSMHIALALNSDRTINGIGAFLGEVDLTYAHRKFLEEVPQVFMEKPLEEKGKWVEFKDTFVADGTERYLVIGMFPYGGLVWKDVTEGPDNRYAYYFIDGISLKEVAPAGE
jgi:OmpA-OmpF porin, OOP family